MLDGIVIEEAVGVTGFPTPFGSAPRTSQRKQ